VEKAELEAVLREVRELLSKVDGKLQPQPLCFSMKEAAERLGVGLTVMKEMVARREIRTSTVGRRAMISLSELERVAAPDEERPRVEQQQREKAFKPLVRRPPPPKR